MIYLYVKTHNKTGLKYLGKTINKDPHKYTGSGIYWLSHLKVHGFDYTTKIIFQSENIEEIKIFGIYYSMLWNIVESEEWANLIIENGGCDLDKFTNKGRKKSQEDILKWKNTMINLGKLGNNNAKAMVETRRLKDNFKSNRDPEVIRKQNESKIRNGTSRKGKKLSPEALAKRIGFQWYNNGSICKKIHKDDIIPEGFIKGKLHKRK